MPRAGHVLGVDDEPSLVDAVATALRYEVRGDLHDNGYRQSLQSAIDIAVANGITTVAAGA